MHISWTQEHETNDVDEFLKTGKIDTYFATILAGCSLALDLFGGWHTPIRCLWHGHAVAGHDHDLVGALGMFNNDSPVE
jgi:hypothetical protein